MTINRFVRATQSDLAPGTLADVAYRAVYLGVNECVEFLE